MPMASMGLSGILEGMAPNPRGWLRSCRFGSLGFIGDAKATFTEQPKTK